MSKSTPIFELNQNNIDMNNDTRPIVADILKEIEMQNSSDSNKEYINEQQKALDYQTDSLLNGPDLSSPLENQEIQPDISNNDEILNTSSNLETPQVQPQTCSLDNETIQENDDLDIDEVLTQKLPSIQEIPTTVDNSKTISSDNNLLSNNSISQLYQQFKAPLLIFLIAMIVTIPQVQTFLNNICSSLPIFNTTSGHMILKSFTIAIMYYYVSRYI